MVKGVDLAINDSTIISNFKDRNIKTLFVHKAHENYF